MRRALASLLACSAIAVGLWLAFRGDRLAAPANPSSEPAATAAAPQPEDVRSQVAVEVAPEVRSPVEGGAVRELPALLGSVVCEQDDAPIAGVSVELRFAAAEPVRTATNERGRFTCDVTSEVRLTEARVGCGPASPTRSCAPDLALVPGGGAELTIRVPAGLLVSGKVLDMEDRPVPAAEVHAWCASETDGEPDRRTTTDGFGAFELAHLGEHFTLAAAAPGMVLSETVQGRAGATAYAEGLVLRLAPVGELRGAVLDPARQPVAEALVQIRSPTLWGSRALTPFAGIHRTRPAVCSATTDARGLFSFGELAAGALEVEVQHPDFARWHGSAKTGEPLEIVLGSPAAISGRVFAWDGAPAAGAHVSLRQRTLLAKSVCDETGSFRLGNLPSEGEAWLAVRAPGNAVHVHQPVALAKTVPPLEIRLSPARALAGRVRRPDGSPAADVALHVEGDRVVAYEHGAPLHVVPTWEYFLLDAVEMRTGAEGEFRFDELYDGEFELTAALEGPTPRRQFWRARSGNEQLELVLDPDQANDVVLEGNVRDALTRAPVQRFTVIVIGHNRNGGTFNSERQEFQSPEGAFELGGLAPADLGLIVQAEGYSQRGIALAQRAAGRHRFDIELSPTRSLHLRLVDAAGQPAARVTAWVIDAKGEWRWMPASAGGARTNSLTSDERGELLLTDLPAETITVRIRWKDITAGVPKEFDLRQPIDGVVEVRLD